MFAHLRCDHTLTRVVYRAQIIACLEEAYETATWLNTIRADCRWAWMLNPLDPFGSLLDEAIRRAR